MALVVYIVITLAAASLLLPLWMWLLKRVGHFQENYRGKRVLQSMGGILVPVYAISLITASLFNLLDYDVFYRAGMSVFGLGFLGLLDDIWGDTKARGFTGHIRSVLNGRVTTGAVKAAGGFLVAAIAVRGLPGLFLLLFWRAVIVALSANFLNLLDLRPGRALKGFLFLSFAYAFFIRHETGILLLLPCWITALVYLPRELEGKGMLGDAGANAFGGLLGLVIVLTAPAGFQVICLIFLVFMHLLAEKYSLTQLIANNSLLNYFDMLGRKGWEK